MLDPQRNRQLLLDALRPPVVYELDYALATTFSLDLLTLLVAPVAFTVFGTQQEVPTDDPVLLLTALKRYADRISLFCQAGRIAIPRRETPLIAYLENSVFEVLPPNEQGVFHPKLWLLRFTSPQKSIIYRLLCLTRNLTFDRSWDTSLILEGTVTKQVVPENAPLSKFIASLPDMVKPDPSSEMPDEATKRTQRMIERVKQFEHEIRHVAFIAPPPFDSYMFWPLGLSSRKSNPFDTRIDRMLIVSPFVSATQLEHFPGKDNILVSRIDTLAALPTELLDEFSDLYVLKDTLTLSDDIDDDSGVSLSGLHAKLYVADAGWDSSIWTGSANATINAFTRNIEFLVQLNGKKSKCGIDVLLQTGSRKSSDNLAENTGFKALLEPFYIPEQPLLPDVEIEALEAALETARRVLAESAFTAYVSLREGNVYDLILHCEGAPLDLDGVSVQCRPVTLPKARALGLADDLTARFDLLTLEQLTGFFAFTLTKSSETLTQQIYFVLRVSLHNLPPNRLEAVTTNILDDPQKVLQFLYLLMQPNRRSSIQMSSPLRPPDLPSNGTQPPRAQLLPFLEMMLRTLASDLEQFEMLARFVEEFGQAGLLPPGFEQIWLPLMETFSTLRSDSNNA